VLLQDQLQRVKYNCLILNNKNFDGPINHANLSPTYEQACEQRTVYVNSRVLAICGSPTCGQEESSVRITAS
jgi:hypothetical protein